MLLSVSGFTQRLNKIGKIEVDIIPTLKSYRIESKNYNHKIYYDSLILEGNTWYDIQNGFLTTLEFANNEKDKIFYYDSTGKLKATILSERVINLKVSKTGNLIAWYMVIKLLNLMLIPSLLILYKVPLYIILSKMINLFIITPANNLLISMAKKFHRMIFLYNL